MSPLVCSKRETVADRQKLTGRTVIKQGRDAPLEELELDRGTREMLQRSKRSETAEIGITRRRL